MRIFKYALKNIFRNSFLSFSSILIVALMVFFSNILFFVEYTVESLTKSVNDRLSISLNLKPGYTDTSSEVVALVNTIREKVQGIDIKFVSATEAFEILKKRDPELAKVIENDKDNPLPSSITIKNVPLGAYEAFDSVVTRYKEILNYENGEGKKTIVDYRDQYQRVKDLANLLISIQYGIYVIIGLFLFSVCAMIYQAIGNSVFFFKEEIKIIGLVGGGSKFIYGPFSIQGFLYAFFGSALGLAVFFILAVNIHFPLIANFENFVSTFFAQRSMILWSEILCVSFAGLLSAFFSSFRFARTSQKSDSR